MTNEIKSKKYMGVYIRTLEDKSKTYYIVYKNPINKKTSRLKIGNSKDGFNEIYCNNKRSEIISKLRLGEDPNIPILQKKQQQTSLNDIALKYFEYKSLHSNSKSLSDRQSRYNKHFKEGIGTLSLQAISKNDCLNLQKKLIRLKYAKATINTALQFGSTIFNYAIKENLYTNINPFRGIKLLSVDNNRLKYLDKEDIKLLKKNTKDDKVLYLFTLIALSTGARLESVLNLQKKDINFKQNSINIYDLKNKTNYMGALIDEVKTLLQEDIKELKQDDYIY